MSEKGKSSRTRSRRRRESGPLTAAGLISFYENYRGKIEISPTTLVIASAALAAVVVALRALIH